MTDEVKEAFRHLWSKAAYQCRYLKDEIEKRYPFLVVMPGHGAFDANEHDSTGKEPGEPDLYIWHNQRLICAVEVTGSDKTVPSTLWLGAHKVAFARRADYPIGFFFFYGKNNQVRYFSTMEELDSIIDPAETKHIHGLNLKYHLIENIYFKGEIGFWDWLLWNINERAELIL